MTSPVRAAARHAARSGGPVPDGAAFEGLLPNLTGAFVTVTSGTFPS